MQGHGFVELTQPSSYQSLIAKTILKTVTVTDDDADLLLLPKELPRNIVCSLIF